MILYEYINCLLSSGKSVIIADLEDIIRQTQTYEMGISYQENIFKFESDC